MSVDSIYNFLWKWLPHRVLKCQSLSTTVLFRTTAAVCSPCRWSCSTYLSNDSWIQTFYSFISNCHTVKWLFNDNQITGLWCYNGLLMVTCPTITFALMKALFLARSHLVGSSLLSELLNWPWARTKLPLKLKSDRSFNIKDLFNFCCCLALVLIGISVAKLHCRLLVMMELYNS